MLRGTVQFNAVLREFFLRQFIICDRVLLSAAVLVGSSSSPSLPPHAFYPRTVTHKRLKDCYAFLENGLLYHYVMFVFIPELLGVFFGLKSASSEIHIPLPTFFFYYYYCCSITFVPFFPHYSPLPYPPPASHCTFSLCLYLSPVPSYLKWVYCGQHIIVF